MRIFLTNIVAGLCLALSVAGPAGAQEVPTLEAVRELFGLPALLGPVGGARGEVAAAVRGETNASLIQRLDRTLLDVRARQLEEVIERKKKVNGLLKDPGLLIS